MFLRENSACLSGKNCAQHGEVCRRSEKCFYHFEAVKADGVFCIRAEVRIIRGDNICRRSRSRCEGVSRVHGGGFAGTIQAFVKNEYVESYKILMDNVFGEGSCKDLRIRKYGGMKVM